METDLTADSLFNRAAFGSGRFIFHMTFPTEQGGVRPHLTGNSLFDRIAGMTGKFVAVAGAAVKGRVGAHLTVDGQIDDRTMMVVILTHMLLLFSLFV